MNTFLGGRGKGDGNYVVSGAFYPFPLRWLTKRHFISQAWFHGYFILVPSPTVTRKDHSISTWRSHHNLFNVKTFTRDTSVACILANFDIHDLNKAGQVNREQEIRIYQKIVRPVHSYALSWSVYLPKRFFTYPCCYENGVCLIIPVFTVSDCLCLPVRLLLQFSY